MKKLYFIVIFLFFCTNIFAQKIKFQSRVVLEKETPCLKGNCASCEIIFPKITDCSNKNLEKKLNDEILVMVLGDSKERQYKLFGDKAKAFIKDYKETKKTTEGMGKWQQKIKVELLEVGNMISLVYREYTYSGGETPYNIHNALHFDIKTAKKITLDDVLVEDYQEKLMPLLTQKLKKALKVDEKTPLKDISELKLDNGKLKFSNAFAFRKDGLHLNYSHFEVTQASIMPVSPVISYKELKPFLKKGNLLGK